MAAFLVAVFFFGDLEAVDRFFAVFFVTLFFGERLAVLRVVFFLVAISVGS